MIDGPAAAWGNVATDDAGKERWPPDEGRREEGMHGCARREGQVRKEGFNVPVWLLRRFRRVASVVLFGGKNKKEVRHPKITLVEGNVLSLG